MSTSSGHDGPRALAYTLEEDEQHNGIDDQDDHNGDDHCCQIAFVQTPRSFAVRGLHVHISRKIAAVCAMSATLAVGFRDSPDTVQRDFMVLMQ